MGFYSSMIDIANNNIKDAERKLADLWEEYNQLKWWQIIQKNKLSWAISSAREDLRKARQSKVNLFCKG